MPVSSATDEPYPRERRANEALANGRALRLGLTAQLMISEAAATRPEQPIALPLPPTTRAAARYASTQEGLAATQTMGFSRSA
ncbi:MAG: hypothetical protein KI785_11550 [Devosiaceae bacterium]|nr:hypothetical protein [Devosiaceae bacterium MH13]